MRNCIVIAVAAAVLQGCAPPVMFAVDVDEPIDGGTLTLNDQSAKLMQNLDGSYWAKWEGSDASGSIMIRYPDGKSTICPVGYVTHGMIPPIEFEVRERKCVQVRYD